MGWIDYDAPMIRFHDNRRRCETCNHLHERMSKWKVTLHPTPGADRLAYGYGRTKRGAVKDMIRRIQVEGQG